MAFVSFGDPARATKAQPRGSASRPFSSFSLDESTAHQAPAPTCFSEFRALTFNSPVTSISFSPDSTRFAVLSDGRIVGFDINKAEGIIEEFQISQDTNATSFCWDISPEPVILVAFKDKPIAAYDVISKQLKNIDCDVYPEVTAMTCAAHRGKNVIVIGAGGFLVILDRERLLSKNVHQKTTSWPMYLNEKFKLDDIGVVKQIEVENGNVAVLTAKNNIVSAFGLIPSSHPDVMSHPWPVEGSLKYGTIALFPGGTSFITGGKNGKIYAADREALKGEYNHKVDVFGEEKDVYTISLYPSSHTYSIFSVAGVADTIRFYTKDCIKNTFNSLEEYTLPVGWTSKTAYNASTGKVVECPQNTTFNQFNPFREYSGSIPSVIHTTFSPNGRYFAYTTTESFVGILKFELFDLEKRRLIENEKKRADEKYWDMLTRGASKTMPGAWVE